MSRTTSTRHPLSSHPIYKIRQTYNELLMDQLTELLRQDGKIWVVVAVIGVVLLGWFVYLVGIGHRVSKVKRRVIR